MLRLQCPGVLRLTPGSERTFRVEEITAGQTMMLWTRGIVERYNTCAAQYSACS